MISINASNEKSFFQKYELSLQKMWESYTDENQVNAIKDVKNFNEGEISVSFEKQDILRIIIGFKGRKCIDMALSNAIHTLRVVIWIPEEKEFLAYCVNDDISDIITNNRISLVVGNNINNLEEVLRQNIFENNIYHCKIISIGKYCVDCDEVRRARSLIEKIGNDVAGDGVSRKSFDHKPCEDMLAALRQLNNNYTISQLLDSIDGRDIPVIIVSAGPSLMKNCNALSQVKGRALIIAVSHAVKTLMDNGIMPDMVAVTDPTVTRFLDCDINRECILLCSVYADILNQKTYNGNIIYYGFNTLKHLFSTNRTVKEPYAEMDTGSVATDVFSIILTAGFKKIILIGQDLAYDENGYTHSDHEHENSEYEKLNLCVETEGIYGGRVKTRGDWERFREYFENKIKENNTVEVIDATEGGALIHGTKVMTFNDVINNICTVEYPVEKWLNTLKRGDASEAEYIKHWFNVCVDDLEVLSDYLDEALSLNESIRQKWNNQLEWNYTFRMDCKRYDILYDKILNSERGGVLRHYCIKVLQDYVENALTLEDDEKVDIRMLKEYDLFLYMRESTNRLIGYVHELI